VASGAYSSIFIASPVLTHWKEREPQYRARRRRIEAELGHVPAYAATAADVDPVPQRARRAGRLTAPEPDKVSAAEFEQMKRDLEIEQTPPTRSSPTRSVTKRMAHKADTEPTPAPPKPVVKGNGDGFERAPDIAENEGVAPVPKPKPSKSRSRNRRHGRRR
jgi:SecD/SecF fusion protein